MTKALLRGVSFLLLLCLVVCKPDSTGTTYSVDETGMVVSRGDSQFLLVESVSGNVCDKMEQYNWYSDFHDCFVDRKYKDGGRDLDNIVDRILEHAETCAESSRRHCRLDSGGFKFVMNKVIEQMKDFSVMYMEAIIKGREKVKDLECVEDVLSMQTYAECFQTWDPSHQSESQMQRVVEEGVNCASEQNHGCSREALTTFNRIVRSLLGVEHNLSESFEVSTTFIPTPEHQEKEETPMNWYDYLFMPFVSAWNWMKSFFG